MSLYLVTGKLHQRIYAREGYDEKPVKVTRLVEAESESEAEQKLRGHFAAASIEYAISYRITDANAYPVIT